MRDIKFRQPLRVGGFHYWGYLRAGGFVGPVGPNDAVAESEQFTGLLDKNGVEIYDGDILISDYLLVVYVEWVNEDACYYCYDYYGKKVTRETWTLGHFFTDGIIVMSNIHEGIK